MIATTDCAARRGRRLVLVPALVLSLLAGCASTPEPAQTVRRVALENDDVLVVETLYPRGGSLPMHTHTWPQVVYVIEGGTLQTTASDGTTGTLELHTGQTLWRGVQSHATRNIGKTTVRLVTVEIKNASTAPRPAEVFPAR